VQINLPKGEHTGPAESLTPGEKLTVEIESEEPRGEPVHAVFRLVRVADPDGHLAESGGKRGTRRFSDSSVRLNYALHGEVNGGILQSGDFLHLKPEGARAVKLKVGMQVEGRGAAKPMAGGHAVIEAEEVNGIAIHHHKAKKHGAKRAGH
jgi:hypothetical protein